ncbi:hypothetical protein [Streptomyces sp. NBC_00388]|uniref:hypothetical protein n=1 Tax=Streptomyces sp. NBC_00388 TaxID=2975735 RepID=UPI002E1F277B
MADARGAEHREEPQAERGAKGSRDTGSEHPSGGPSDRPAGTGDAMSDTSVRPRKSADPDAPDLQSGGG